MTAFTSVTDHPVNARWPAKTPDVLQLYSFPTPNGVKVSAMLEETGLPYEAHTVTLADADVKSPEFLALNPNNKIPAIIDPDGPGGKPLALFESGAILIYLAEKTGQFLSPDPATRYETLQWVMFQMGGVGPMFGQLGFFYAFAGKEIEDKRPVARYIGETKRLLDVLETRLTGRDYIVDDYSIADICTAPWLRSLDFYGAKEVVGWGTRPAVEGWFDRVMSRPALQAALNIPPRP
ncbi:glutathione S-transferase family protein [Rhodalgimonas zhirmunskyi]|uniref:Glutathione S-transferase N-terminal domain-containing protein n=1 Tax=Rhodalgimonas zhirmunskyi TaxID=2964767 RepID=A0AAJ1X692_9RHOB|nr:glutathione S-transferase N-terminal domain-containing protein [Rhodoalgimonas zhirmunskyi]MDQ2094494.1 glutathione S-transferase N-terminal domain-containing protein [Rhodoalgimonas zhirmunskyi]